MNKQELKNYLRMNVESTRLKEKINELRNKVEKPKSALYFETSKGGEHKDFTDYIDKIIELSEIYAERQKAIIYEQIRIETAIAKLDDPVERAVLGYYYIDGFTWEQVCVKIGNKWRNTHYIHANALRNISEVN